MRQISQTFKCEQDDQPNEQLLILNKVKSRLSGIENRSACNSCKCCESLQIIIKIQREELKVYKNLLVLKPEVLSWLNNVKIAHNRALNMRNKLNRVESTETHDENLHNLASIAAIPEIVVENLFD